MNKATRNGEGSGIQFPNSKVELHQWANSILLLMVGFVAAATYNEIHTDHDTLAKHETRITVLEDHDKNNKRTAGMSDGDSMPSQLPPPIRYDAAVADEFSKKKLSKHKALVV